MTAFWIGIVASLVTHHAKNETLWDPGYSVATFVDRNERDKITLWSLIKVQRTLVDVLAYMVWSYKVLKNIALELDVFTDGKVILQKSDAHCSKWTIRESNIKPTFSHAVEQPHHPDPEVQPQWQVLEKKWKTTTRTTGTTTTENYNKWQLDAKNGNKWLIWPSNYQDLLVSYTGKYPEIKKMQKLPFWRDCFSKVSCLSCSSASLRFNWI